MKLDALRLAGKERAQRFAADASVAHHSGRRLIGHHRGLRDRAEAARRFIGIITQVEEPFLHAHDLFALVAGHHEFFFFVCADPENGEQQQNEKDRKDSFHTHQLYHVFRRLKSADFGGTIRTEVIGCAAVVNVAERIWFRMKRACKAAASVPNASLSAPRA